MPYQNISIPIFAGINGGINESKLAPGEVRGADNFLFARGEARTRPGLASYPVGNGASATRWRFAKSFPKSLVATGVYAGAIINAGSQLWGLIEETIFQIPITGAVAFTSPLFPSIDIVNQVVLIGGNTHGLLRYDTNAFTATVLTDAKYRYVCGHGERAVAAFLLDGSVGSAVAVAWSDSGDETSWVPGGASSAGTALLIDIEDDITGIFTLHNLVVIPHESGFHVGTPTGTALPAYTFEPYFRTGVGPKYPPTITTDANVAYYVGEDDVYTFDLQKITPIGYKIRDELIAMLRTGIQYQGFIGRTSGSSPRSQYHLFPVVLTTDGTPDPIKTRLPHFIYDIYEDSWSRCSYDQFKDIDCALFSHTLGVFPQFDKGMTMLTNPATLAKFLVWDDSIKCESPASMELPTIQVGDLNKDYRVESVMLKHRNLGDQLARVVVGAENNSGDYVEGVAQRRVGNNPATERWMRTPFRPQVVGQFFTPRIEVPAGSSLCVDQIDLSAQEAGEYKGRPE